MYKKTNNKNIQNYPKAKIISWKHMNSISDSYLAQVFT